MPSPSRAILAMLLAASSFLGSCGSAPAARIEAEVVYVDHSRAGFRQTLRSESAQPRAEAYQPGQDPMLKIAPDAQLRALLEEFRSRGFEAMARGTLPNARHSLTVVEAGNARTWSTPAWSSFDREQASAARIEEFVACLTLFQQVYNANTAYHSQGIPRGTVRQGDGR